jgi:hypothetical protein
VTGDFITGVYKLAARIKKAPTITEVSHRIVPMLVVNYCARSSLKITACDVFCLIINFSFFQDQAIKFASYLLSRKYVQSSQDSFFLLSSLSTFADNQVGQP